MSTFERKAFSGDVLPLIQDQTVEPFYQLKAFDLDETLKRKAGFGYLPLLTRPISIDDIQGKLTIYGDLITHDLDFKPKSDEDLLSYFAKNGWNNTEMRSLPLGVNATFTVSSIKQLAQLEQYYLELRHGKMFFLQCSGEYIEEQSIRGALDALGEIEIPNLNLVDEQDDMAIDPFPAHAYGLSLLSLTLRQFDQDDNEEDLPFIEPDPGNVKRKELLLV